MQIRIAEDIVASAEAVASSEKRTTAGQIDYWARLGMQLERSTAVVNRQIRAVVDGHAQFSTLSGPARNIAHSMIDARIAERAAKERFGHLAQEGSA